MLLEYFKSNPWHHVVPSLHTLTCITKSRNTFSHNHIAVIAPEDMLSDSDDHPTRSDSAGRPPRGDSDEHPIHSPQSYILDCHKYVSFCGLFVGIRIPTRSTPHTTLSQRSCHPEQSSLPLICCPSQYPTICTSLCAPSWCFFTSSMP